MAQEIRAFTHQPLPHPEAIRVLKLQPADNDRQDVNCELLTILPGAGPDVEGRRFEAVSWCWGSDGAHDTIFLHQQALEPHTGPTVFSFNVTRNMHEALKALRYKLRPRYLWIDAISINQSNTEERNQQVPRMDTIYGDADNVCIWVGKASDSSHDAIEFIENRVLKLWNFDKLCEDLGNHQLWHALVELMKRPWFSRRWVVQEIALAKRGTLYCGNDKIDWQKFANAVSLFVEVESASRRLSEVIRRSEDFGHVPDFFGNVPTLGAAVLVETTSHLFRTSPTGKRERLSSLENLVSRSPIFNVMEPRDTIYALLAMSKDSNPHRSNVLNSPPSPSEVPLEVRTAQDHGNAALHKAAAPRIAWHLLLFMAIPVAWCSVKVADAIERKKWQQRTPLTEEEARLLLAKIKRRLRTPEQEVYEVDYAKPVVEVYRQFIAFSIRKADQTRALDIICRPWAPKVTNEDQWRFLKVENDDGILVPKITLHTEEELKREVPLPSWIPRLEGAAYVMTDEHRVAGEDDNTPFTKGMKRVNADSLVGTPDSPFRNYSAAGTRAVNRKRLHFKKRRDHHSMFVEGFILDTIKARHGEAPNGQIPRKWHKAMDLDPNQHSDSQRWDTFWRTLVADRGPKGSNPPTFYPLSCLEVLKYQPEVSTIDTHYLINMGKCSIVAEFLRRVQATIWERQLIETENEGSLGLTNKKVEVNDKVCILYGCSVPVILREHKKSKQDMDNDEFDDNEVAKERAKHAIELIRESQKKRREAGQPLPRRKRRLWRHIYDARDFLRLGWFAGLALYIQFAHQNTQTASLFGTAAIFPALALSLSLLPSFRLPKLWTAEKGILAWKTKDIERALTFVLIVVLLSSLPSWFHFRRDNVLISLGFLLFYPTLVSPDIRDKVSQNWAKWFARRQKKPTQEVDEYWYEFIGEAYIHGMMNGEAIAWQNEKKSRAKAKEFEIR